MVLPNGSSFCADPSGDGAGDGGFVDRPGAGAGDGGSVDCPGAGAGDGGSVDRPGAGAGDGGSVDRPGTGAGDGKDQVSSSLPSSSGGVPVLTLIIHLTCHTFLKGV
jgi:hypothetical protein